MVEDKKETSRPRYAAAKRNGIESEKPPLYINNVCATLWLHVP